jgi:Predicted integral membrane protein
MDDKNAYSYNLQWKNVRRDWPLWILMAGLLITAVWVYPHLPDQVPRHWNLRGEPNAYFSRTYGAFFPPLMVVGLYLLMLFMPIIDPKRDNYRRFTPAYTFLRWTMVLLISAIYISTILTALGYPVNEGLLVRALLAVLFIIIGNFMGQFRHNYFVGIKTPWTLANEDVWQQTHRLGSKIWVIGGLVCLAVSVSNSDWAAILYFVSLILMTIIPIVYSYIIFRKLNVPIK